MNRFTLDIIFGCIALYYLWKHVLRPKALTFKIRIKEYRKHLLHLHAMNNDIYSQDLNSELLSEAAKCKDILSEKDKEVLKIFLQESQERLKMRLPQKKNATLAENLDILLVAFSLAFAVRALFLQPFKIPTGSMQPTLHGVNMYEEEELKLLRDPAVYNRPMAKNTDSGLRYFLNTLYYGESYVDKKATNAGTITSISAVSLVKTIKHGIPLLESFSDVKIDGHSHFLPIPPLKIEGGKNLPASYREGDVIFKGVVEDGDHLFVNRIIYNFREPKRGDIAVFMTNKITYQDAPLRGQFYIKRLVGLPGETLRIYRSSKKLIKEGVYGRLSILNKDQKFEVIDEKYHPCFKKLNSGQGGYHGHLLRHDALINQRLQEDLSSQHYTASQAPQVWPLHTNVTHKGDTIEFSNDKETLIFKKNSMGSYPLYKVVRQDGYEATFEKDYDEYKLGDRQYFMLGDNSAHSLDSRYWGPVDRQSIIGTPFGVFWPFSQRWGLADKYQPQDKQTIFPGKF